MGMLATDVLVCRIPAHLVPVDQPLEHRQDIQRKDESLDSEIAEISGENLRSSQGKSAPGRAGI
jgi:hypothetical protein